MRTTKGATEHPGHQLTAWEHKNAALFSGSQCNESAALCCRKQFVSPSLKK